MIQQKNFDKRLFSSTLVFMDWKLQTVINLFNINIVNQHRRLHQKHQVSHAHFGKCFCSRGPSFFSWKLWFKCNLLNNTTPIKENVYVWNMFSTIKIQFQCKKCFFTKNGNVMPELFHVLKYARFYAKEQFFLRIIRIKLKA